MKLLPLAISIASTSIGYADEVEAVREEVPCFQLSVAASVASEQLLMNHSIATEPHHLLWRRFVDAQERSIFLSKELLASDNDRLEVELFEESYEVEMIRQIRPLLQRDEAHELTAFVEQIGELCWLSGNN